ncbi:TetR/AcrR family transcriptional regulator [Gaopeijia maritima]|uniref:TetR/AcrR family transcriptional regulator n=1 Tax=Gaopeijia maritima TaxID=3119007 RepID=UPI00327676E9
MGRPRAVTDEQIIAAARRCFLDRGAGVPASEIARDLGVSHTTLFNRFGSKEGLLVAALEPPREVPWVEALEAGPDGRPVRDQLVEHARVISAFYAEMEAGLSLLRAAGVEHGSGGCTRGEGEAESAAERGYHALVAWLERAQRQESLAICDSRTLASTILGALHGWTLTATACGQGDHAEGAGACDAGDRHVERVVDLLWHGIGPRAGVVPG